MDMLKDYQFLKIAIAQVASILVINVQVLSNVNLAKMDSDCLMEVALSPAQMVKVNSTEEQHKTQIMSAQIAH